MKIAIFHNLPPGGAKRTLFEQVKHLGARHEIYLFRTSDSNEFFLPLYPYAKLVHTCDFFISENRIISDVQKIIILPLIHMVLAYHINKLKPDIVLVHADRHTQAPYLTRFLRVPCVYFCQEMLRMAYEPILAFKENVSIVKRLYELTTRNVKKNIDQKNMVSCTRIVANSSHTAQNIKKHLFINSSICRLGVDTSEFVVNPLDKKQQFLFVDQKDVVGGYDLAIKSVNMVRDSKRHVLKVLSFVRGNPTISTTTGMSKEYSKSVALICTSYNEPFGIPPLESMACGTPVLAVNEGGYKETVVDGVTGWLLPRDPKAFAEKIEFLIKNPTVAKKMGMAGRRHVIKNFTWKRHCKQLEKILYEVAAS